MMAIAIATRTSPSGPRARPLASRAVSNTKIAYVIAPAMCMSSGVRPLTSSISMYCGSSVV